MNGCFQYFSNRFLQGLHVSRWDKNEIRVACNATFWSCDYRDAR